MAAVDLTEFLLARIAEDAAFVPPERIEADSEVKRLIVQLHVRSAKDGHVCPSSRGEGTLWAFLDDPACDTLRLLALPYADHHDYDEAWRP